MEGSLGLIDHSAVTYLTVASLAQPQLEVDNSISDVPQVRANRAIGHLHTITHPLGSEPPLATERQRMLPTLMPDTTCLWGHRAHGFVQAGGGPVRRWARGDDDREPPT
ncbi:hypothetical protein D9613_012799 [Agrocybe pediades]|uniref:Uncharacterized protein n=1 Tax=Agrocybe pediades TaxID=84607 RepID=A0A8H4R2M7_9AGAR|nr:hypothetical protein D9613_012799 [Agrocybe pediades]